MAGPLTKKTKQGELYVRPPHIEKALNEVQALEITVLLGRLAIHSSTAVGFIPSECLLHLIRAALRNKDHEKANKLLPWLLKRCEANLRSKIAPHRVSDAEDLRDELLGRFAELIAEDLSDPKQRLDYYECHFNDAFRAFRVPLIGRARREYELRITQAEADLEEEKTEDEFLSELAGNHVQLDRLDPAQRRELREAIDALPSDQRKAVTLVYVFGFPEDSDDPSVETAAKRCGISGRALRYRLRKALVKLSAQVNSDKKREQ